MADDSQYPDSVLFREVETASGQRLGFARLNAEKSLNALSLDMIRLLTPQLQRWAADDGIACVVLQGAGEKAFCAGGDVRNLCKTIKGHAGPEPHPAALAFFSEEYRLDHLIHRYPKPMLVWGSGIVMGGGVGLMVGASHRVVTETSRIAMPEISIGLFPDVGGSKFLSRMPARWGLFTALTGVSLNANDALAAGLADHCVQSSDRERLFKALETLAWSADLAGNHACLSDALRAHAADIQALPASNFLQHADAIELICKADSLTAIAANLSDAAASESDTQPIWLQRAARTFLAGSPTTAALIWALQHRAPSMSLEEVFRMELIVALQCCAHADFQEGVRALLIDKDHAPKWQPANLDAVNREWIAAHFAEPTWPNGISPLSDL